MYKFATLDPRPTGMPANEEIFASGPVYGIEVTVPSLAERCVVNIDPQHLGGGDGLLAAIEVALILKWALPSQGDTLATIRPDLDSVGTMAIFSLRAKGLIPDNQEEDMSYCPLCTYDIPYPGYRCPLCGWKLFDGRVEEVAIADNFARGGYAGPKPLPTRDNPWNEEVATAESSRYLAAISAAVGDFKVPLADRVSMMETWLLTGEEPKQYRDSVERERLDLINALEGGQIKYETRADGRIAVVESTHRAATSVGYSLAPVVVARNPAFKLGGGEAHVKYTICAFEAGKFADIKSALAELATLETGWGGSPTIGGSPQGVSSKLTLEQVVAVVEKYLLD